MIPIYQEICRLAKHGADLYHKFYVSSEQIKLGNTLLILLVTLHLLYMPFATYQIINHIGISAVVLAYGSGYCLLAHSYHNRTKLVSVFDVLQQLFALISIICFILGGI
jgi:hypothetical protein